MLVSCSLVSFVCVFGVYDFRCLEGKHKTSCYISMSVARLQFPRYSGETVEQFETIQLNVVIVVRVIIDK